MEFSEVVRARRSVRDYSARRPDPELVDGLIDVARRAPTAGFSQGVDFLVIDDAAEVENFWSSTSDPVDESPDVDQGAAPMVVIVLSDPERYIARYSDSDKIEFGLDDIDAWPVRFWDIDAGMAAMQLQLAAVNEGLATWFFGIAFGEAELRERLGIPSNRQMVGVVAMGYRAGDEVASGSGTTRRRRPLSDQLHRNGW